VCRYGEHHREPARANPHRQSPPLDLVTPSKVPGCVRPRSLLCYWAVRELGLPGTAVAARLHLTQSAVSRAVRRGERLAREQGLAFPQG
jgi:hypothetical protein